MSKEPLDSAMDWVAEHTRKYVETGGEDGYMWRGFPTVVLTTTGRKSGDLRRNALIYGKDGDDFILIASYGGRPTHPLWYLNLGGRPVGDDPRARRRRERCRRDSSRGRRTRPTVGPDGVDLPALRGVPGEDGTAHPCRSRQALLVDGYASAGMTSSANIRIERCVSSLFMPG
jgi:deazaflavin-dependent oxidoreductase (nitroreductase family)